MRRMKLLRILITALLCIALSTCALAADFANVYELFVHWEQNGYPPDVAGVYSNDGSMENLTIQLIGDTDGSREAEIRAMLEDDSTVSFEAGTYSTADLQRIHEEIVDTYMSDPANGIYSCGVGWSSEGGFGPGGNESRVVVTVAEDRYAELLAALVDAYGGAVYVEVGAQPNAEASELPDPQLPPSTDEPAAQPDQTNAALHEDIGRTDPALPALWICIGCLCTAAVIILLLLHFCRRRKS